MLAYIESQFESVGVIPVGGMSVVLIASERILKNLAGNATWWSRES
jgi:hypothetical protein